MPKSKTDQHREGHVVYISRIKPECFPVKYLEAYLQKAKLDISGDKSMKMSHIQNKVRS